MIRNLAVTILFAFVVQLSFAQELTLEQTLVYLQQKIDKFGHFDGVKNGLHMETKLALMADDKDMCRVTLKESEIVSEAANVEKVKEKNVTDYTVELKHLDKDKLDIYGTDGFVNPITLTLRAKNSAHNIRISQNEGKESYDFKTVLKFRANLKDIQRVKKALAHAVNICESMDVDPFD